MSSKVQMYEAYDKQGNSVLARTKQLAEDSFKRIHGKSPERVINGSSRLTEQERLTIAYNGHIED